METLRGVHAVREALSASPGRIRKIVLVEGRLDKRLSEIAALARTHGVPVYREPRERLARLAKGGGPHQGVVAELGAGTFAWRELHEVVAEAPHPALLLALDQVEDPRNLGAAVRAADGAGVHGIIVPERRSAPPSEVAVAASAGALLHASLARVVNLADALIELKKRGIWVVGLDAAAPTRWCDFDFTVPVAIVLGSEGKGLRPRVAKTCDALVSLPQMGRVASLNLSVAAGVVLYEALRQRLGGSR